ncbi:MAG: NAD-dependent epimerase/dehydratase family protein [Microbacterium sp.]|uniref:NAD-dependent epimerase/dehydratase family protein n=1 Tax=Microbacterium sp. TaxID=51671 RepID=UPI001ACC47B2|nr:NAD-dependent epimerase/dehydratase family protein [Microbacterium sp.]MBN9178525.1 NAD-dependent epimerase/dehydratase family protein [Microbacterium sp.]
MRNTVIVTGAAGYVGRHVVRAVEALGFDALAIARRGGIHFSESGVTVEGDVLDPSFDLRRYTNAQDVAALIHLAWQDGFVHNATSHMLNLSRHFEFLTGMADAGVPRIAALGTMHEVGYWEGAIAADTPTNPLTLYGIAKDALRRSTTIAIGERSEYVWLRAYYIVGDDRRSRSIFTKLLEAADRGERKFPFTTGKTLYDFIDVEELGRQIAVAALTPGAVGVVNVCSGQPESLANRVEQFIADNHLDVTLEYGAFPDRPYDSPGTWGDASMINALMASSPYAKETNA